MTSCGVIADVGLVRNVLSAVDCNTRGFAQAGYESLTAPGSSFQMALTLFLTLYVAATGYRLLFATGGARLSDGPAIALKIGAILTLLTSWSVFQALVFDLAAHAPVEIARAVAAPLQGSGGLASDPVAGVQFAYDQLSKASADFAKPARTAIETGEDGRAAAAQALSLASGILFMASAGLVAMITVAIGVLTAVGPLFVALFLFVQTRGFFVGWVRAIAAAAFALFGAWTLTVLMLHVLEPWLVALARRGADGLPVGQIGLTTATIVFVFAASQASLLLASIVVARGFRLNFRGQERHGAPAPAGDGSASFAPRELLSRPAQLAEQLQRRDEPYAAMGSTRWAVARDSRSAGGVLPAADLADFYRRPAIARAADRRGLR